MTDPAPRRGAAVERATEDEAARSASDPATCPLCGGPNECVLGDDSARDATCWCVGHRFPDTLFAQVPAKDLGRRCVCQRCALGAGSS